MNPEDQNDDQFDVAMEIVERADSRADGLHICGNVVLVLALVGATIMLGFAVSSDNDYDARRFVGQVAISVLLSGWITRMALVGLASVVEVGAPRLRFDLLDRYGTKQP